MLPVYFSNYSSAYTLQNKATIKLLNYTLQSLLTKLANYSLYHRVFFTDFEQILMFLCPKYYNTVQQV